MIGVATNNGAEGNEAVIDGAACRSGIQRKGNHRGNLQRTRHGDDVVGSSSLVKGARRTLQQSVGQPIMKTGLDDKEMHLTCGTDECLAVIRHTSHEGSPGKRVN